MELTLGAFGDERLEKGGPFRMSGLSAWRKGRQRAGARGRSRGRDGDYPVSPQSQGDGGRDDGDCPGAHLRPGRRPARARHSRHLGPRVDEKGVGLSFHPVIAVDANAGTMLGLVDNFFLTRQGGERDKRKQRAFEEKDSRRWLKGAEAASALAEAGAACATVIEDREGDIYECFAFKPAAVEAGAGGSGSPSGRRDDFVLQDRRLGRGRRDDGGACRRPGPGRAQGRAVG